MQTSDFDYELPDELIAQHPPERRGDSPMIVLDRAAGTIAHRRFADLPKFMEPDDLLVLNDTKVVAARFFSDDGRCEILRVEALDERTWKCLVRPGKRFRPGATVAIAGCTGTVLSVCEEGGERIIRFDRVPDEDTHGHLALPPYIRRPDAAADRDRYQTVYAAREGSVAAPTAGLHFTEELLQRLEGKGIRRHFVTLHVGAGTFLPVKVERMEAHRMHGEFAEVGRGLLDRLREDAGPIIAVGTTSLRTLESLYWLGRRLLAAPTLTAAGLDVGQWEPYGHDEAGPPGMSEALGAVADRMDAQGRTDLVFRTELLIAPGYRFRVAGGLVTNFHQPRSTLLLLIAAWMGGAWKEMYRHALDNGYRFLSYGDGCLLAPPHSKAAADI